MKVVSNDGQEFEIDADIAKQSTMLKQFSDEGFDGSIPLPNVKASMLKPIIDFCNHHKNDSEPEYIDDDDDDDPNKDIYEPKRADDISEWDQIFIQQFTAQEGTLFDIIMAANYLGIKSLLGIGCKAIAYMVRGKSSSEIHEMFNISYEPPQQSDNSSDIGATSEVNSTNK